MNIRKVSNHKKAYIDLLLLADEQVEILYQHYKLRLMNIKEENYYEY